MRGRRGRTLPAPLTVGEQLGCNRGCVCAAGVCRGGKGSVTECPGGTWVLLSATRLYGSGEGFLSGNNSLTINPLPQ